jgi:hypothetical protein
LVTRSLADRFEEKVLRSSDPAVCDVWIAATAKGYGYIKGDESSVPRMQQAHRVAWELVNGPIPDGLIVCHHCDTPPCVKVSHLFLGTQKDNMADASAKGRARNHLTGRPACSQGHLYTDENTYWSRGYRYCRRCQRVYDKRRRAKERLAKEEVS